LKTILSKQQMELSIQRLAHQMLENNKDMANTVIIGLQPRGIFMSDRIVAALKEIIPNHPFHYGKLDITFYRDDVTKNLTYSQ
jgi:pyrimidine operon attenuation protein/uracil phosphoribosyltransferase